jgi:transcriptional regulator with XRE-family HTH domain
MPYGELSRLIRRELDKGGVKTLEQTAAAMGVSKELARSILSGGHIPKDRTLIKIAHALGLEPTILILSGHRHKLPLELREEMLPVALPSGGSWEKKRKWPLSQEQCDYLGAVMRPDEIQFIRKCRQLTPEERIQLAGYVNFMFATCRVPPPPEHAGDQPAAVPEAACMGTEEGETGMPTATGGERA